MADQLEPLVAEEMFDVAASAAEEIINANHISPLAEEAFSPLAEEAFANAWHDLASELPLRLKTAPWLRLRSQ